MSEGIKRGAVIAGMMLLAALAVAGWTRNPSPTPTPADQVVAQRLVPAAPARVRTNYARPVYESAPVVRRRRSTGQSVAIVGGSAGVGAAIGALAGGGRGAAIGALSGGGAGLIYDRLTRNKVRER